MKNLIESFKKFEIRGNELAMVKGGSGCTCHQAAPYACTAAGYATGSSGHYNCMVGVYLDCCSISGSGCTCNPIMQ